MMVDDVRVHHRTVKSGGICLILSCYICTAKCGQTDIDMEFAVKENYFFLLILGSDSVEPTTMKSKCTASVKAKAVISL